MNKKLLAVAVAAALAPAFAAAQTNVTMYGVVDTALSFDKAGSNKVTQLTPDGQNTTNRWGLRGSEDLGGGLKANFQIESTLQFAGGSNRDGAALGAAAGAQNGAQPAAGALSFSRVGVVGLSGGFGSVDFGRQYTPHFLVLSGYDVFGTTGASTNTNLNTTATSTASGARLAVSSSVRSSNAIIYNTPNFGNGFSANVLYNFGEQINNAGKERNWGFNLRYEPGNWGIALGYNNQRDIDAAPATPGSGTVNSRDWILAGQYTFAMGLKLQAVYHDRRAGNVAALGGGTDRAKDWTFQAAYTTGPHTVRGSLTNRNASLNGAGIASSDGDATVWGLGYVYDFSKRTAAYVTLASLRNKGTSNYNLNGLVAYGGAGGQRSSTVQLGVTHRF